MFIVESEDSVNKTLVVSVIIVIVIIILVMCAPGCQQQHRPLEPSIVRRTARVRLHQQRPCTDRKYWSERDCLQGQVYSEVPKFEDVELYRFKDLRARQRYNEFIGADACGEGCRSLCNSPMYAITSPNLTNATLYSSADVDPLVTGQLYANSNQTRNVYAQRTSMGDEWGLKEYNSSGEPGDVGVDVGPDALYEYAGKRSNFDDGIPEQWAFPSTPIRWYAPSQRDYYGPQGPTAYTEGLYALMEPDHIPKMP